MKYKERPEALLGVEETRVCLYQKASLDVTPKQVGPLYPML